MSLPFLYREYNFDRSRKAGCPRWVDIQVTEQNWLDVLCGIIEARPKCCARETGYFSVFCCDFWNPPESVPANAYKLFHSYKEYANKFIHVKYGTDWAIDRDFIYSVVVFMVENLEYIDREYANRFGIPMSAEFNPKLWVS